MSEQKAAEREGDVMALPPYFIKMGAAGIDEEGRGGRVR